MTNTPLAAKCRYSPTLVPNYGTLCVATFWHSPPPAAAPAAPARPRRRPKLLRLVGLAVAAVLLTLGAPTAAHAAPAAHDGHASVADTNQGDTTLARNICAVGNPNGSGYYTYRAMEVISGNAILWEKIYCLWVPKVTPNFGSLCGFAQWKFAPLPVGPISWQGPVPRYTSTGAQDWRCP